MKNSLADLNNYRFEQIERLQDDGLDDEALKKEIERGEAVMRTAETIIANAGVQLRAAKFAAEMGMEVNMPIPLALSGAAETDREKKSRRGVKKDAKKEISAGT